MDVEAITERVIRHKRGDLTTRVEYFNDLTEFKLNKIIPKDASILQLGCGCGYLLEVLKAHGYTNLTGVDKNPGMREDFPEGIKLITSTVREALATLPKYDVVFTHTYLYRLPPIKKNEELFKTISKSFNQYLITFEEEEGKVARPGDTRWETTFYNYNYKKKFEKLGLKQTWMDVGSMQHVAFRIFTP